MVAESIRNLYFAPGSHRGVPRLSWVQRVGLQPERYRFEERIYLNEAQYGKVERDYGCSNSIQSVVELEGGLDIALNLKER